MTTMTSPTTTVSHQTLIDARLDTIDRMLIDRVSRPDRIAIVREVESQILEQLSDRDPSTLSRDDVLDVLRRLDPPEAYLPDEIEDEPLRTTQRQIQIPSSSRASTFKAVKYGGLISGLAGLTAFALILVECVMFLFISALTDNEGVAYMLLLMPIILGIGSSIVGFVMGVRSRREGTWPIVGIIFSSIAFPIWGMGSLYLCLMILF